MVEALAALQKREVHFGEAQPFAADVFYHHPVLQAALPLPCADLPTVWACEYPPIANALKLRAALMQALQLYQRCRCFQ